MLVLSRKKGEKVRVGDNITITVVDVDRGKIRLGFEAEGIPIYREEVYERMVSEQAKPNQEKS